jgi:membrane carboxypeptidase/penicillin-binding protein
VRPAAYSFVHAARRRNVDPLRSAEPRKRRWWSWNEPEEDEEEPVGETPRLPLNAATILLDEPYEIVSGGKTWSPRNYDEEFRGPVTVQRALEESLNVPTARAAAAIGFDRVARTARALGIRSTMPELPSLALGTAEVTPLEMASAFATIANAGVHRDPWLVRGIDGPGGIAQAHGARWPYASDGTGADTPPVKPAAARGTDPGGAQAARARPAAEENDLVPASAAWIMTGLLEGVMIHGTGRTATQFGFDGIAAGKTGTSDGGRDLWFCGYTPDLLTLVWVGFDDGTPTHLSGAHGALPIWADYMKRIGAETTRRFEADSRLLWAPIDPSTGLIATRRCPDSRWAPFLPGTEPVMRCTRHESFWDRWRE